METKVLPYLISDIPGSIALPFEGRHAGLPLHTFQAGTSPAPLPLQRVETKVLPYLFSDIPGSIALPFEGRHAGLPLHTFQVGTSPALHFRNSQTHSTMILFFLRLFRSAGMVHLMGVVLLEELWLFYH